MLTPAVATATFHRRRRGVRQEGLGTPIFLEEIEEIDDNHFYEYMFIWNTCAACPMGSPARERCGTGRKAASTGELETAAAHLCTPYKSIRRHICLLGVGCCRVGSDSATMHNCGTEA